MLTNIGIIFVRMRDAERLVMDLGRFSIPDGKANTICSISKAQINYGITIISFVETMLLLCPALSLNVISNLTTE